MKCNNDICIAYDSSVNNRCTEFSDVLNCEIFNNKLISDTRKQQRNSCKHHFPVECKYNIDEELCNSCKYLINQEELTKDEKHELYICISCRIGIIETGVSCLRAADAKNCGKQHLIKALTSEQMKLILMLEKLQEKMLL